MLELSPVCNETKYPGPCFGYFPRYYYNNVTKTCEKFIYGGCKANGNNFVTLEECKNTCWVSLDQHALEEVEGFEVPFHPCPFHFVLMVRHVTNAAGHLHPQLRHLKVCTYPADSGPCKAYMPRFFYNTETRKCEQFIYGGCGGNANNFLTFDACEKKCLKVFGVIPRA
ncbi:hypothetical protein MTO96_023053 [Rhipicephalus appendiculatus]